MAIEREIKLRVESLGPVRDRLAAIGATFVESVIERNHILDTAGQDLFRTGCGLRVREVADLGGRSLRATVTFKGKAERATVKSREELETAVGDAAGALAIFEALGFGPVLFYEKRRESWSVGLCRVELDEPPAIGRFVEIEGPDKRDIEEVRTRLGLDDAIAEPQSYVRMLVEYCDARGIRPRRLSQRD